MSDRREGLWNRTLLAGVSFSELIISQFLVYSLIVLIINFESLVYIVLIFKCPNYLSYVKVLPLLMALGWTGIFFGIVVSVSTSSSLAANAFLFSCFGIINTLGGIFVPNEKLKIFFKGLVYCLPFTNPANAIRDILFKDFGFFDASVLLGSAVSLIWIIILSFSSIYILRKRKFYIKKS
jgi:hypothetical protein